MSYVSQNEELVAQWKGKPSSVGDITILKQVTLKAGDIITIQQDFKVKSILDEWRIALFTKDKVKKELAKYLEPHGIPPDRIEVIYTHIHHWSLTSLHYTATVKYRIKSLVSENIGFIITLSAFLIITIWALMGIIALYLLVKAFEAGKAFLQSGGAVASMFMLAISLMIILVVLSMFLRFLPKPAR